MRGEALKEARKRDERRGPKLGQSPPLARPRQPFFVLQETPCPYLPGRWERKLITELPERESGALYNLLSRAGFRRSHRFAYRPACSGCAACVPVRIRAREFRPSRSQRRVVRRNGDLTLSLRPASANREQFELFTRYLAARHDEGEMAGMRFADYRAMVEDSTLDSSLLEARASDGRLVAAVLTDWLEDGPSAVYSFFEPTTAERSLGSFLVLSLIEAARRREQPYVYLGYWIDGAPKMAYKTRFRPIEGLGAAGWQELATES